jgi:hypothetical protein
MPEERHPLNAPGDFYVTKDGCIACELTTTEAPDLVGFAEKEREPFGCYFKKQPGNPDEVAKAIRCVQVACCGAVRYGGKDTKILRELKKFGQAHLCDVNARNESLRNLPPDVKHWDISVDARNILNSFGFVVFYEWRDPDTQVVHYEVIVEKGGSAFKDQKRADEIAKNLVHNPHALDAYVTEIKPICGYSSSPAC